MKERYILIMLDPPDLSITFETRIRRVDRTNVLYVANTNIGLFKDDSRHPVRISQPFFQLLLTQTITLGINPPLL